MAFSRSLGPLGYSSPSVLGQSASATFKARHSGGHPSWDWCTNNRSAGTSAFTSAAHFSYTSTASSLVIFNTSLNPAVSNIHCLATAMPGISQVMGGFAPASVNSGRPIVSKKLSAQVSALLRTDKITMASGALRICSLNSTQVGKSTEALYPQAESRSSTRVTSSGSVPPSGVLNRAQ
eukprot:CAMPEP_0204347444 /NCGR_PEP_ID=MMETSP0469-20131031/27956_1 /ASSEMBLY_ACC=CAM_ASM_000384 /TAXON_ID=2969 /ORGANISM="Oxyrrhis marina" /LENGTH=178 /DNA_ID=CAMNT_0051333251 /DNA_START=31 /DNA_END=567 /DNA_ORIENTATION=+